MHRNLFWTLLLLMSLGLTAAEAQPVEVTTNPGKLSLLIPELYGPNGLFVETLFTQFGHQAHFNSAFLEEFTQFNIALTSELTALPLPSPASGFTYTFDPQAGAFERSTASFGPILAERAETIGRGKFTFGSTFQYFSFDSLEGQDLEDIPAVFTHDQVPGRVFAPQDDLVTTVTSIDATVSQFSFFFTYGLANRLDVSVALPVVSADMTLASTATIQRVSGSDPTVHFYEEGDTELGSTRVFRASGSASGIGDIIVRAKGTVVKSGGHGLALLLDTRFPTGDEENLLGSGAWGLKPFVAYSYTHERFSPHANVGYLFNGDSVLAGDVMSSEKADVPDSFLYAFGADVGATPWLTVVFDILGQRVIDSPQVVFNSFTAANGSNFPNLEVQTRSFNIVNGAAGFKANVAGRLLVDFNLLFKLNDEGLRDKLTPLIGIEYTF